MAAEKKFYATGRRKDSSARVYLKPGSGKITINKREASEYFKRGTLMLVINQPFEKVSLVGQYDVDANVCGGGLTGQAGAVKLGISRALLEVDEGFRPVLRKAGFLTRDPREVERKKYGQPGARARFQYSKR